MPAGSLRLIGAAILALLCTAQTASAQDVCPAIGAEGLPYAIEQHRVALGDLLEKRGVPDQKRALTDVMASIASNTALSPQDETILLYARQDDWLCAYVLKQEGLVGYARKALPQADLDVLQNDLRMALAVATRQAQRAGVPRSALLERGAAALAQAPLPDRGDAAAAALASGLMLDGLSAVLMHSDEIIAVPIHGIGTVPFAMLPLGSGQLIDHAALTVAPSLLALADAESLAVRPSGPVAKPVGFAPGWPAAGVVGNPDATQDGEWAFPRLPGAEAEALAVARHFRTSALIGPDATPDAVRALLAQPHDLIYIAAHATSSDTDPLTESFLALTGGRLTAGDIQSSRMPVPSLVVLSACQTGLGQDHAGGVIGLSRGFLLAGASAVVVSLWSIDDAATATLMTDFATQLDHARPVEALRLAMLAARDRHPDDPALWAGFSYQGGISAFQP